MRKMLLGIFFMIGMTSCQYVNDTVETLKSNVRNSLEVSNLLPSLDLKQSNEDNKAKKDSVNPFTLGNFFRGKFDL